MIATTSAEQELEQIEYWYRQLQSNFSVYDLDKATGAQLLDSQAGVTLPVHSWYILKEACAPQLPIWALERIEAHYGAKIRRVLDPFVGCGTTGLALSSRSVQVDGIEYNPFIRFVATVKANAHRIDK